MLENTQNLQTGTIQVLKYRAHLPRSGKQAEIRVWIPLQRPLLKTAVEPKAQLTKIGDTVKQISQFGRSLKNHFTGILLFLQPKKLWLTVPMPSGLIKQLLRALYHHLVLSLRKKPIPPSLPIEYSRFLNTFLKHQLMNKVSLHFYWVNE